MARTTTGQQLLDPAPANTKSLTPRVADPPNLLESTLKPLPPGVRALPAQFASVTPTLKVQTVSCEQPQRPLTLMPPLIRRSPLVFAAPKLVYMPFDQRPNLLPLTPATGPPALQQFDSAPRLVFQPQPDVILSPLTLAVPVGGIQSDSAPRQALAVGSIDPPNLLPTQIAATFPAVLWTFDSAPQVKAPVQSLDPPNLLPLSAPAAPAVLSISDSAPQVKAPVQSLDPPNLLLFSALPVGAQIFDSASGRKYQPLVDVIPNQFVGVSATPPAVQQLSASAPPLKFAVQVDISPNTSVLSAPAPVPAVMQLSASAPITKYAVQVDPLANRAPLGLAINNPNVAQMFGSSPPNKAPVTLDTPVNLLPLNTLPSIPQVQQLSASAPAVKYQPQVDVIPNKFVGVSATPPAVRQQSDSAPITKYAVQVDPLANSLPLRVVVNNPLVSQLSTSAPITKYQTQVDQQANRAPLLVATPLPKVRQLSDSAPITKYALGIPRELLWTTLPLLSNRPQVLQQFDSAPMPPKTTLQYYSAPNVLPIIEYVGPEIPIPNVVGDTLAAAEAAIVAAGFVVGTIGGVIDPNTPIGNVSSQSPSAGSGGGSSSITWVQKTALPDGFPTQIAFGESVYIAIGLVNDVYRSTDGLNTWNQITFGVLGDNFFAIATDGAGTWLVAGEVEATGVNVMYRSTDNGVTWSNVSSIVSLPAMQPIVSLIYGNGIWVALGGDGSPSVNNYAVSTDGGITWTNPGITSWAFCGAQGYWTGSEFATIVYDASFNANAASSPDGNTWTLTQFSSAPNNSLLAYNSGVFIAPSSSGDTVLIASTVAGLTTATPVNIGLTDYPVQAVGVSGSPPFYIAFGYAQGEATSSDGVTWTQGTGPVTAPDSNAYLFYLNGAFVSFSDQANVAIGTVSGGAATAPAGSAISLELSTSGNLSLSTKFVPGSVGAAIMTANPGNIHPRITPPERDTTLRIDPWPSS